MTEIVEKNCGGLGPRNKGKIGVGFFTTYSGGLDALAERHPDVFAELRRAVGELEKVLEGL